MMADILSLIDFLRNHHWWEITVFLIIVLHLVGIIRLYILENKILLVKRQTDNLEEETAQKVKGTLSNQRQLDRMVEKKEKPLMDTLEELKMKRQFLLDKLPLIGLFKK